ncbi:hypothetical protein [Corynebacterium uterequi]|uniref:Uncharacterized protein n=1 Tax=Corynebacterium uterequi TaxID=1072256 RepID=A0A0G3HBS1_9CORY|nr:hypothetical protein [Corynebacterium uterequi]AKK10846.1 hypothetical protein CUTER_04200 [Corynebacterium uterequi]
MSFFEDIATALDAEGIESRVHDDTMFVPITSDLEIQFVEIDPVIPAANVYIAAADVDVDDEEFEARLVSVVFSVSDAVSTVASYVAEDQVVTVLEDLLEGTDERIADLEFFQDAFDPNLVRAEVGDNSELRVVVEVIDGVPTARVQFVVELGGYEDALDEIIGELWESDADDVLSEEDRQRLFADVLFEPTEEYLGLGEFVDFDKLFDVLSLAADQAADWEEQLDSFDDEDFPEPEIYDIFGEDDLDDEDVDDDFDDLDDDLDVLGEPDGPLAEDDR